MYNCNNPLIKNIGMFSVKSADGGFFLFWAKGGESEMKKVSFLYEDDKVLEKALRAAIYRKYDINNRNYGNMEVPPSRPVDYETKIKSGFRIFEMAEKGYPHD